MSEESNLNELALEFDRQAKAHDESAAVARSTLVWDPETKVERIKNPFALLYHELRTAQLYSLSEMCHVLHKELEELKWKDVKF